MLDRLIRRLDGAVVAGLKDVVVLDGLVLHPHLLLGGDKLLFLINIMRLSLEIKFNVTQILILLLAS